jgi:hypothetical protein
LQQGKENQIAKGSCVIARMVRESAGPPTRMPDFLARLRAIYGDQKLEISGAKLFAEDRDR